MWTELGVGEGLSCPPDGKDGHHRMAWLASAALSDAALNTPC